MSHGNDKQDHSNVNIPIYNQSCLTYLYKCVFDELTPLKHIEILKPDVYVNGSDDGENFLEKDVVVCGGGKIYLNQKKGASSNFLERIRNEKSSNKAVFFDRDGVILKPAP